MTRKPDGKIIPQNKASFNLTFFDFNDNEIKI